MEREDERSVSPELIATTTETNGNWPVTSSFWSVIADNSFGPSGAMASVQLPQLASLPECREISRQSIARSACLHQKLIISAYPQSSDARRRRCYLYGDQQQQQPAGARRPPCGTPLYSVDCRLNGRRLTTWDAASITRPRPARRIDAVITHCSVTNFTV